MKKTLLIIVAAMSATPLAAQQQLAATEIRRFAAEEAGQGAAAGPAHVYAVVNSAIGKYAKADGAMTGSWRGADRGPFVHINSCKVRNQDLVCSHSNFPGLPMASSIETFDAATLAHKSSHSLGTVAGSLTWLDHHDGGNWAGFAEYDGKGGTPGRDHRWAQIVTFDDAWRRTGGYILPETVLARLKPHAMSGGAFGSDGLLYLSGHDRPELYAMRIPTAGSVLEHVATIQVPFEGQAFSWDMTQPGERIIYAISRPERSIVELKVPAVDLSINAQ